MQGQGQGQGPRLQGPRQGKGLDLQGQGQGLTSLKIARDWTCGRRNEIGSCVQ